jgi:oligopeptide/dipeptide ABC transporter ATP-binding protein
MSEILLEVKALNKVFPIYSPILKRVIGGVRAAVDLSFTLKAGETMGVVGESGCGKTTLGRIITHVYKPSSGKLYFDGRDITSLKGVQLKEQRKNVQMIFQDPYSSLNPKMRVNEMVAEPLWVNRLVSKREALRRLPELLDMVGLRESDADKFPHQFSGGQRQRVGIARAIAMNPRLIVADEAVSALDVSIQAQILNLMMELKKKMGLSYIFISHNLAVVKYVSDKIGVMYLGSMVEMAPKKRLFENTLHPYTKALLSAAPVADRHYKMNRIIMKGDVPNPANPPPGCVFHERCSESAEICKLKVPVISELEEGHTVACHLYQPKA